MSNDYVAVVGAVNIDILGKSFKPLISRDSNPGEVNLSLGGVGRNICHNLRLLDVPVQFLTAIGQDLWAQEIETSCKALGIGLERAISVSGGRTSSYLCIAGPDGDLSLGLSDTDVARHITSDVILKNLDMLNGAAIVVFDGNITPDTIKCLCENVKTPLFSDPVSVTKAQKLRDFLPHIHTLKPNIFEAQLLTGKLSPDDCATELCALGVKRTFVSDGANGIFACEGGETVHLPAYKCELINATGGGDAAMAALCRAFLDGRSLADSARWALASGAIAVSCGETINPELSVKAAREIIEGR